MTLVHIELAGRGRLRGLTPDRARVKVRASGADWRAPELSTVSAEAWSLEPGAYPHKQNTRGAGTTLALLAAVHIPAAPPLSVLFGRCPASFSTYTTLLFPVCFAESQPSGSSSPADVYEP
uniref:Uncharacterized protein n=1 Tax=Knipowitschia caucasica TaxID=637954 RepID=A0AAV2KU84_KNICA